jgi:hypothetical protein
VSFADGVVSACSISVRSSSASSGSRRDPPEDLAVRQRLADRRDRRTVEGHVVVAVREMQVPVLELRRRRQHDVGPVRGVGEEVLQHDGEQILARQPAQHGVAVGRDGGRIAVVDDQRANRWAADARVGPREGLAQADHVDGPRGRTEVGALERRLVEGEVGGGGQLHAAAGPAPVAGDRRQTGDVAHGHAAAGVALQAVVHSDECRARAAVPLAERDDRLLRQPRDRRGACGRPGCGAGPQLVRAERVALEVVAVLQPPVEHHVHQPQGEGGVGARPDGVPFVALRGRAGPDRVDADDRRAALARLQHEGPEMRVRRERVRSPQQDQIALGQSLPVGPDARAHRHAHADRAGHRADRAVEARGAEEVEEATVDG